MSEELFQQAQRVRTVRQQSKEKPRVFSHYLKGSVYCGLCGEPLTFAKSRNRLGVVYDYFICLGRNNHKNGCTFRAIHADQLEQKVIDQWASVTLTATQVGKIRKILLEHMGSVLPSSRETRRVLRAGLERVERDSQKLLNAYYADAIAFTNSRTSRHDLRAPAGHWRQRPRSTTSTKRPSTAPSKCASTC